MDQMSTKDTLTYDRSDRDRPSSVQLQDLLAQISLLSRELQQEK